MTSFSGSIPSAFAKGSDVTVTAQIMNLLPTQSPTSKTKSIKLGKSPLKPSNESLLEHYKYEKQSKVSSGHLTLSELYARGESIISLHNSGSSGVKKNQAQNSTST